MQSKKQSIIESIVNTFVGFTFQDFKKKAKRTTDEDEYTITFTLDNIEATINAGSPWWVVSEIS